MTRYEELQQLHKERYANTPFDISHDEYEAMTPEQKAKYNHGLYVFEQALSPYKVYVADATVIVEIGVYK